MVSTYIFVIVGFLLLGLAVGKSVNSNDGNRNTWRDSIEVSVSFGKHGGRGR